MGAYSTVGGGYFFLEYVVPLGNVVRGPDRKARRVFSFWLRAMARNWQWPESERKYVNQFLDGWYGTWKADLATGVGGGVEYKFGRHKMKTGKKSVWYIWNKSSQKHLGSEMHYILAGTPPNSGEKQGAKIWVKIWHKKFSPADLTRW